MTQRAITSSGRFENTAFLPYIFWASNGVIVKDTSSLSGWRLRQLGIVNEPGNSDLSGNRPLDRSSKGATSRRSRNRIYSVGLVVPKSSEPIE
jgi:hypothetical protein